MRGPATVLKLTAYTLHATQSGSEWRGELLNERGEVLDGFSYIRERFPGAVVGAPRVSGIGFAPELAGGMWLHTAENE